MNLHSGNGGDVLQSLYGNANKGEYDLWELEQNKKGEA